MAKKPRHVALSPAQDLAAARTRARAARSPVAKRVTQEVVEAKKRSYGVPGAKQPSARTRQLTTLPGDADGAKRTMKTTRKGHRA